MKNLLILFLLLFVCCHITYSQCNFDKEILCGTFNSIEYNISCPSYSFAYNVETASLSILDDNDIKVVEKEILPIKKKLEKKIIEYAGYDFFSKLEFYDVDITYPDSIAQFTDRMPSVDMEKCKAKYAFQYYFRPIKGIKYCVGFALDENLNIISEFNFPRKNKKNRIKENVTICDLYKIAEKELSSNLFEQIDFEFDTELDKFWWVVEIKHNFDKSGFYEVPIIKIDPSDFTKTMKDTRNYTLMY